METTFITTGAYRNSRASLDVTAVKKITYRYQKIDNILF